MKKGFTLIELLMTLGIVGILLVVLTQVFGSIITLRLKTDFTSTIAQDSRYILSMLEKDLVSATLLTLPAMSTTSTSIIMQSQGETVSYALLDSQLVREEGGISLPLNTASTITSFSVSRPNDLNGIAAVTISFALQSAATSDTPAQLREYQSTYALRTR